MKWNTTKGGVLKHGRTDVRRLGVVVAGAVAMVVTPLALSGAASGPVALVSTSLVADHVVATAPSAQAIARAQELRNAQIINAHLTVPSTTTTAPPPPPTTAPAPTTTTTRPHVSVAPTTTSTAPAPANSRSGIATWFATGTGSGFCASHYAPMGARITVAGGGSSVSCVVNSYEAAGDPYVVDLAPGDFGRFASTDQGAIGVTISW